MHKQEKFKDANFELNTINSKNGNQILDAEREPKIERPRSRVERPKHEVEERPKVERPKHEVEERPKIERPKHEVEERPRPMIEGEPKIERPRTSEGKLHFVIDISTDKKQLLELRKILIELEFNNYEKEGGKKIIENDERKIRRR